MNEVLEFFKECGVFFVSTVDGNQPRVRPFSFAMEYDGKLCFATSNQKPVYAQLIKNPNVEISASSKDARWLRLSGKAVFCTSKESKTNALEVMPMLKHMYSPDDTIFEIFYLENAVGNFYSLQGESKSISL
ncbi:MULTISPECIES: pyridoxamine 5'-phosphate oxidase family protein [Anaerotignum]|uniref:pyridoxamine 5'-phosphate oxidase family protein n=1 Tax=Anaerotignum TaxID=2039240 RepID=UPI00210860AC|nr:MULTISPECIES: pyridoxamine 5'-phosphate oxidase family protein [Anaerotignum]MCQ4935761.1 pyridoxamine 5'-phosphate oxidase family protein [Anaerotignum propionicum]